MSQKKRMLIVILVMISLMAALIVYNAVMRNRIGSGPSNVPLPGMISLFIDGVFRTQIMPADLDQLTMSSCNESEQGKTLKGWLLRDVIMLYVDTSSMGDYSEIAVFGARDKRGDKAVTLTWKDVSDPATHVLLHPSKDGQSLKLVSTMDQLDTRDEWVQGVMRIDITTRRSED